MKQINSFGILISIYDILCMNKTVCNTNSKQMNYRIISNTTEKKIFAVRRTCMIEIVLKSYDTVLIMICGQIS